MYFLFHFTDQDFITSFGDQQDKLSIIHINARSLSKNFDSVINFMHSINNYEFTFIAITETWFHSLSCTDMYNIDGYKLIHRNRLNNRRGGGVALYIREPVDYIAI